LRPSLVPQKHDSGDATIHVAFLYVANQTEPFSRVEKAVEKILHKIFPAT